DTGGNDTKKHCWRGIVEVAERGVIIFQPPRPGWCQRPLHAQTCGPSPTHAAEEGGDRGRNWNVGGDIDPLVEPGRAALDIEQRAPACPRGPSDTAGKAATGIRTHPAIGENEEAGGRKAGGAAVAADQIGVGVKSKHRSGVGNLPIVADLPAAEPDRAPDRSAIDRRSRRIEKLRARETAAELPA